MVNAVKGFGVIREENIVLFVRLPGLVELFVEVKEVFGHNTATDKTLLGAIYDFIDRRSN